MARLESPDPVAEFRRRFGNPIGPKDTFEVLVRDRANRDPSFYESYAVLKEKLFILNRSKFCERSVFFRQELEKAESASSDPNTRKRVIFENHEPDDFEDYLRFLSTGKLDLAADNGDHLFPLLRLYVLADQLGDFTIANLIMNDIIRASDDLDTLPAKKRSGSSGR